MSFAGKYGKNSGLFLFILYRKKYVKLTNYH